MDERPKTLEELEEELGWSTTELEKLKEELKVLKREENILNILNERNEEEYL